MLFEIYRGASKFINSGWYTESLYQQFIFSDTLMVLKDPRFKSCERIYTIDFSRFPFSLVYILLFGSVTIASDQTE